MLNFIKLKNGGGRIPSVPITGVELGKNLEVIIKKTHLHLKGSGDLYHTFFWCKI